MRLLVVEDEDRLARMLARGLGEEGHQVDVVRTGSSALEQGQAVAYDVVVLDWALPELDGLSVIREWRARGLRTPVLFLTARGTIGEKVTALRAGADDYLTKPFAFDELVARVEALHRRGGGEPASRVGAAILDPRRRVLTADAGDGQPPRSEPLTAREFALLSELASHQGEVLSRSRLLETVWGGDEVNPNVVDVYVGYLRGKLARLGLDGVSIQAVRGVGFKLVVEPG
jgi:DNA-binding response OmpR family regulator